MSRGCLVPHAVPSGHRPPTAQRQSTKAQSVGSGAALLGTDSLSPSTCCVTSGGFWETLSIRMLCDSSGAVLRVVRMSGGWQGRTAWGGDGVGGPAHPPGCCQKWAGMRELAYSVFTILMGHVDPPWRLCFAGEQQPSQSPKDWLATTPSFWGLAHLWSRWLQGAGCQGPRSPCFGPQTLQLRRSLTSCVMT